MANYLQYVNTKMGTKNTKRFSNGNVYPVIGLPHGMTSFSLQTRSYKGEEAWFYNPDDVSLEGIRLTHQPSPWIGDYGHMLFNVTDRSDYECADFWWSGYNNKTCLLMPHTLEVSLKRYFTELKLSPTQSGCVISLDSQLNEYYFNILPYSCGTTEFVYCAETNTVLGYTTACTHDTPFDIKEYFVIGADKGFIFQKTSAGYALKFVDKNVELKIATSFISYEQARTNYETELGNKSFDSVKSIALKHWEDTLSLIEVEGDEERKKTFYTCLYRAMIFPRKFYETDKSGKNLHINNATGEIAEGVMYTDNGFWDTYRTVYPLLAIIQPKLYAEMVEGFYNIFLDTGWLPRWISPTEFACMPGTLIEAVFADAIVKEIVPKDFGLKLLDAMIKNAETDNPDIRFGRKEVGLYRRLGYVPKDKVHESVNETLDCCYGDFCIYAAAKHLGEYEIAERYQKYTHNYKNIFDAETGFMRGRNQHGEMSDGFDPIAWGGDYAEGGAWQSSFAVYHDIAGLDELYCGKLCNKIDEMFARKPDYKVGGYKIEIHEMAEMAAAEFGQCAISNQPSFHIPYIYAELGEQAKTNYWVEQIVDKAFSCTEEGFPGDEDNGTTAAWYIFACMGFYPLCPGKAEYTPSKPLFDTVKINVY